MIVIVDVDYDPQHSQYLTDHVFSTNMLAIGPDLPSKEVIAGVSVIIFAIPTQGLRCVPSKFRPLFPSLPLSESSLCIHLCVRMWEMGKWENTSLSLSLSFIYIYPLTSFPPRPNPIFALSITTDLRIRLASTQETPLRNPPPPRPLQEAPTLHIREQRNRRGDGLADARDRARYVREGDRYAGYVLGALSLIAFFLSEGRGCVGLVGS